jgi:hypothetical protein
MNWRKIHGTMSHWWYKRTAELVDACWWSLDVNPCSAAAALRRAGCPEEMICELFRLAQRG